MAGHWRKHEAGFFSVELPPDWVMQELESGAILLGDGRGEVAVRMTAISKPGTGPTGEQKLGMPGRRATGKEAQYELQRWIAGRKNVTIRHEPRVVGSVHHAVATTEGVELGNARGPWFWRWLRRRPGLGWRFWSLLNGHVLMLVSCSARPEALVKLQPLLDRMIASVRLPERDILLGRHFADKVVSLARAYFPALAVAVIDDGHLRFGTQPVSLTPLHRRYLLSPEDLPTQVKTFLAEFQGELPGNEGIDSWSGARRRILPSFLATAEADGSQLVHEPWVNHLSISYLLEDGHSERPVTAADASRWQVDEETLHEQALKNLIGKSQEQAMEVHKSDGYSMLLMASPEKHNAARLLLPELHGILREHLGPMFYAAIPAREFLLAFSTPSEEVLGRVRQQIAADFARAKNAVSPRIFLVTPDGIAGDPAEEEDEL